MPRKPVIFPQIGNSFEDVLSVLARSTLSTKHAVKENIDKKQKAKDNTLSNHKLGSKMAGSVHRVISGSKDKPLVIDNVSLSCYVLDDETRVLAGRDFQRALGQDLPQKKSSGQFFTRLISNDIIRTYLNSDDLIKINNPVEFDVGSRNLARGYDATLLPAICAAIVKAKEEGKIDENWTYFFTYRKALSFLTVFAKVGIVALIDEVTGYQQQRKADALRILVEQYIREDARDWTKEFPDEFFAALDRAYGNPKTHSRNRPQYYGRFINSHIYEPIERGLILHELKELQKTDKSKRLHLFLTDQRGLPVLRDRISKVTGLLQASKTMTKFKRLIKDMEDDQMWFPGFNDNE